MRTTGDPQITPMARVAGAARRFPRGPAVVLASARLSFRRRGFTMAEMVVAVSVMVIVTAIVAGLFAQVRKMIGLTQWNSETRAQLRSVVSTMARDLANIDSNAYFLMLNRDYGWDPGQAGLVHRTAGGQATAPVIYPADAPLANRRLWADRLGFVAVGPFSTLQGMVINGAPVTATSARVYYGQSLWTHELADMVWMQNITAAFNPFLPTVGPVPGPYQMNAWPDDFAARPAKDWSLLRRAILNVMDPAADWSAGAGTAAGLSRPIDWRAAYDQEFHLLDSSLNACTTSDLARLVDQWVWGNSADIASLLLPPRVDRGLGNDASMMVRARMLLPHTAKLRFQVRLSNGTVVPRTDETQADPRLRGGLVDPGCGLTLDYGLPTGQTPGAVWPFAELNPAAAPNTAHPAAGRVPVKQVAYVWTPHRTNVSPADYPVAVRVRIEVYDPQQRAPDPIALDEWLPVRWHRP